MDTFVAYPNNLDFNQGSFHRSSDNYKKVSNFSDIKDFLTLSHTDKLIYLLPSSAIGSYAFERNDNLSTQNNLANFISDIDSFIVNDVSENEFFLFENIGFVMDKRFYNELNRSLNQLKCKVILIPDYFLNKKSDTNTITEFNNRFLFSFNDGTGSSTDQDSLAQYLDTVKSIYINFEPNVFINKSIKELDGYNQNKNISIAKFISSINDNLPNLFKFEFSFQNIFNKLNFSRIEIYACLFLITSIIALPYIFTAQNNKQMNIYEDPDELISISLGSAETTLINLTSAYCSFVNGGKLIKPILIDRIQDGEGNTIINNENRKCIDCDKISFTGKEYPNVEDNFEQVLSPQTAYQLTSILKGAVERGTGKKLNKLGLNLAGKTGTTNDNTDAWFIGFTSNLVIGVYVGMDNPKPLGKFETGSKAALPIFEEFVKKAVKKSDARPFKVPKDITLMVVDPNTGNKAKFSSKNTIIESYKSKNISDGKILYSNNNRLDTNNILRFY